MTRKAIALIATSLVVGTISTTAFAASKADREVRQLIRQMDKDRNGVVSKSEFMEFMSEEFDRADVNKNGTLEPRELQDWHRRWGFSR
jgi:Ca2+-binding EF-hand superfamily protein